MSWAVFIAVSASDSTSVEHPRVVAHESVYFLLDRLKKEAAAIVVDLVHAALLCAAGIERAVGKEQGHQMAIGRFKQFNGAVVCNAQHACRFTGSRMQTAPLVQG